MTLLNGLMALYRPYLLTGAIRIQDNSDGNGPFVAYWNEQVVGVSEAEGVARALALGALTLVQTQPYRVECTHPAVAGATVMTELVQDGIVVGAGTATVNGNTAHEIFIVPKGHYTVRFRIEEPSLIGGELEVDLWQL
ncbi:MAG: hypothetical protein K8L91_07975 [Anaerolineae bacterium]|nr:hypothetical protein [Anaerolineae bacterium]